ncbi:hypothetical protein [Parasitella parasitica]|uniref:Uncharacterized protein n=1 Tax=Parasitella parasitica TaxID=35722 RepID=A0A0B7N6M4_9FUNG|nr:hypothetical protein [Parasitella parasitica]
MLKKTYNIYSIEQKALFLYLLKFKFLKVKPAAEHSEIKTRTAQGCVKRMREDPEWNIYDKLTNKINCPGSQLQEKHKQYLIHFFDERPQATRQDAVEALTADFKGFSLKESQVGTFIKNKCKYASPKVRNCPETLLKRKVWVEKWSKTDMNYLNNSKICQWHTIDCYNTVNSFSESYDCRGNLCHGRGEY